MSGTSPPRRGIGWSERRYDPVVPTHDALAIDGGMPVRAAPLDFSKGAALLGAEEADA